MLNVTFVRVREDGLPRLRAWLRKLDARRDELIASYAAEGTHHEQFFLLRDGEGPLLVLVSELTDTTHGKVSFLRSHQELDLEFKRLIQEIRAGEAPAELLFDSLRLDDAAGCDDAGDG